MAEGIVRNPVPARALGRRTPEERIALAAPWLLRSAVSLLSRLSARSRVRRLVLVRALQAGWEANNRRDYEALLAPYDPEVEFRFVPGAGSLVGVDMVAEARGGIEVRQDQWSIWWVSRGLVVRQWVFADEASALEALVA